MYVYASNQTEYSRTLAEEDDCYAAHCEYDVGGPDVAHRRAAWPRLRKGKLCEAAERVQNPKGAALGMLTSWPPL